MKVLFVSSGTRIGLSPIIKNQGESLKKQGIEVEYYLLKHSGIKGYIKSIPLLRKYLKDNEFDIIHAHYGYLGIVAHFARTKEKLVVSMMGSELLWNKISGQKIIGSIHKSINNLFCRYYDHVIVKSKELLSHLNKENNNYSVIPNGVSFERFKPISTKTAREYLGWDTDKIYVVFPGNPERPEKNFSLTKESLAKTGLDVTIVPFKNIPNEELVYYYNAANLVLFTSIYEGSPNVIKESLACNANVVSTPCGDVPEILPKCNGCRLVKYDSSIIKDAVLELINDQEGSNGREMIEDLKDTVIASKIINIYRSLDSSCI